MKEKLIDVLMVFVAWYLSMLTLIYFHESVHSAIYKNYNCYSYFEIDPFSLSGTTYTTQDCELPSEAIFLHSLNELVGYSLATIVTIICINTLLFLVLRG